MKTWITKLKAVWGRGLPVQLPALLLAAGGAFWLAYANPSGAFSMLAMLGAACLVFLTQLPRAAKYGWCALVLCVLLPLVGTRSSYFMDVATQVGMYVVLALGLNITVGYCGLFNLGYIAFYALGAYAYGLLCTNQCLNFLAAGGLFPLGGGSFWLFLLIGGAIGCLVGFLIALPVIRISGDYLCIVTLAFCEIIRNLLNNMIKPLNITNGAKGDKGDNAYVWIRYASQKPTAASHSFGVLPDNWMGVYSGNSATAPTDWTQYQWFEIKGEKGDIGNPALLTSQSVTYQASTSGNVIPSGNWQGSIPTVAQGAYLWTRVAMTFNSGTPIYAYSVSRMGLDGTGAVSKVCGKEPNSNGNVELEAENVGALPSVGGLMTGNIVMNSNQIKMLGAPSDNADAANKSYVDTALNNAKTVAKTATLTVAGWSGNAAPYTQSVTISDLTNTKRAMAYPVYGSNTDANIALKEACGMVSFASRSGNKMTFTCLEDKPTVAIPITVEVYV